MYSVFQALFGEECLGNINILYMYPFMYPFMYPYLHHFIIRSFATDMMTKFKSTPIKPIPFVDNEGYVHYINRYPSVTERSGWPYNNGIR